MIGSFEIFDGDVLGRIGRLTTKSGVVETPHLFPVVNPVNQTVPVEVIKDRLGFTGIMTNSYLMKRNLREGDPIPEVHRHLNYNSVIATDSGAYQLLVYGRVEADPIEIVEFQEKINTDMAIILDIPTGSLRSREEAKRSVDQTIAHADLSLQAIKRTDIVWLGPIQGGTHLDLLAYCAKSMGERQFHMMALGSPTKVMERYLYKSLVDMMITAKMNIPAGRPIHLFGAGHPSMLALAVACGYDTFDSAAYALYARDGRYMTPQGTLRLEEIKYFPCTCDACRRTSPRELSEMAAKERASIISEHNLWVCRGEIQGIKQAIKEGRLWELVASRARAHPALYAAFKRLALYREFLSRCSPLYKRRGIMYFSSDDYARPEITNYLRKLERDYAPPKDSRTLVLVPRCAKRVRGLRSVMKDPSVHTCFYAVPFGIIPCELEQVYPLSQVEVADENEPLSIRLAVESIRRYVGKQNYRSIVLILPQRSPWRSLETELTALSKKRRLRLKVLRSRSVEVWSKAGRS